MQKQKCGDRIGDRIGDRNGDRIDFSLKNRQGRLSIRTLNSVPQFGPSTRSLNSVPYFVPNSGDETMARFGPYSVPDSVPSETPEVHPNCPQGRFLVIFGVAPLVVYWCFSVNSFFALIPLSIAVPCPPSYTCSFSSIAHVHTTIAQG